MQPARDFERYAVIAAMILLVIAVYLVLRPFLTAFLWGGILAVSTRGLYCHVLRLVGGRHGLAAALTGVGLAAVLLVPIATLGLNVAGLWPEVSERVAAFFAAGIPRPPSFVAELPFVGKSVSDYWTAVAADPQRIAQDLRPLIKPVREFLVAFSAGVGAGILEFGLALLMASLLYIWGDDLGAVVNRVVFRLAGESGQRQLAVVASTVRGVFNGVIGTAAVQGLLALVGFWIAGVPGAFLLGIATCFLSVVPGGPVFIWLPATLWLYATGATGWAIFMAIWGTVIVSGSDNVIRPLLIGQGVSAPLGLIFLGVIGGILAFGFLGLFIGPTVLAVAFNLFQDWLATHPSIPMTEPAAPAGSQPSLDSEAGGAEQQTVTSAKEG